MSKEPTKQASEQQAHTEDADKALTKASTHNQKKTSAKKAAVKEKSTVVKKGQETSGRKSNKDEPPVSEKQTAGRSKTWLLMLTLLVAIGAAGLAGYDYWLLDAQIKEERKLSAGQDELRQYIDRQARNTETLQRDLMTESRARKILEGEQAALSTAWQNMSVTLGRTSVAWRLAEVEYLLSIANHRLTLARDRDTAIQIFASADQRIRAMGDPRLLAVRRHIAEELTALRSLDEPDIAGITFTLSSLIAKLESLPLIDMQRIEAATQNPASNTMGSWQELPRKVWEDIKRLVQVRRHNQAVEPLLPPQQAWYLTQNLRLKLEQARLAVMQRDTALFRQHLGEAETWLKEYFDQDTASVTASQNMLAELARIELKPPLPDVGGSLQSLRDFQAQQPGPAQNTSPVEEKPGS